VEASGKEYALKALLKNASSKQRKRFLYEVKLLTALAGTPGVIQLVDSSTEDDTKPLFYVMQLGEDSLKFLNSKDESEVVNCIKKLAGFLEQLHRTGIYHRDIKPENILFINSEPVLADFGLARRQGDPRITQTSDRQIGAKSTMAPEMLRTPYSADYTKADVYSLAKTLWIFLTKKTDSFDGCYSTLGKESLWKHDVLILGEIEQMLAACTSNAPETRWTLSKVRKCCKRYIELSEQPNARQREAWRLLKKRIFPYSLPEKAGWLELNDIIGILNLVLDKRCWNHVFLPVGGGLDLEFAGASHEDGCIELNFGGFTNIIKPRKLAFFSPGGEEYGEQDYFILEADNLDFVSSCPDVYREELTELSPMRYTDVRCKEWNDFNGANLPQRSRTVIRWRKGKFGIFMGGSFYNQKGLPYQGKLVDAYKALHEKIDSESFFTIFKSVISAHKAKHNKQIKGSQPIYHKPIKTKLYRTPLTSRQKQTIRAILKIFQNEYAVELQREQSPTDSSGFVKIDFNSMVEYIKTKEQRISRLKRFHIRDIKLLNALYLAGSNNTPPYGIPLDEALKKQSRFKLCEHEGICSNSPRSIIKAVRNGLNMFNGSNNKISP